MRTAHIFAVLLSSLLSVYTFADDSCSQQCEKDYKECKESSTSPNGIKVCGQDYHACQQACATDG